MLRILLTLGGLALLFIPEDCLFAQYPGQYPPGGGQNPPGQYPPGQYPPGQGPDQGRGGIGIPWPGRNKKSSKDSEQDSANYKNLSGMLRLIDEKTVVITAADTRTINLKRSVRMKLLRDGKEIKESTLRPGDQVSIEATQDEEGFYTAVNVTLEKVGTSEDKAKAERPVDISIQASAHDDGEGRSKTRRKDSSGDDGPPVMRRPGSDRAESKTESVKDDKPQAETKEDAPTQANDNAEVDAALNQVERVVLPGATDAELSSDADSGRPRLQRGARAPRVPSEPVERASAAPKSAPPVQVSDAPVPERRAPESAPAVDPRIERARAAVETFTASLPNYVCKQQTARFISYTRKADWQAQDVVGADLVYADQKEKYENLTINGKPVKKRMDQLSGSWSTGEFASIVGDLFWPATDAKFSYRGSSRIAAHDADKFDFAVTQENSRWKIMVPSQAALPAYRGTVWIDRTTAQVLRMEMASFRMPVEFPMDKVESAIDFDFIRIGERQFLLPIHAETLTCYRGTDNCSRNVIDFRNYHRFTGDSTVDFKD